jgi:hypothetical protein
VTLLAIMRKLWRYKLVTLPIIGLALFGSVYVVAFKPPVYQSSVSYILFTPPPPPTESDILKNPAVVRGADNPYTRFADLTVVAQLMATRLSSDETRASLAQRGAVPSYTAEPGGGFSYSTPTIQITGIGPTAQTAIKTADVVGSALTRELDKMQEAKGVAAKYRITTQPVVPAHGAKLMPSGTLRALFGVVAIASILLFFVVSILDAVAALRWERADDQGGNEWDPPDAAVIDFELASAGGTSPSRIRHFDDELPLEA